MEKEKNLAAVMLAKKRWKGKTSKERQAHISMMNAKRAEKRDRIRAKTD